MLFVRIQSIIYKGTEMIYLQNMFSLMIQYVKFENQIV